MNSKGKKKSPCGMCTMFNPLLNFITFCTIIAGNFLPCFGMPEQSVRDFNIFTHRMVTIGKFENKGDPDYSFLGESISSNIYSGTLSIPYLTITQREKSFLEALSAKPEFKDKYIEAKKDIGYILDVFVDRGKPPEGSFALYISGSFNPLSEQEVSLSIEEHNYMTGETRQVHEQVLSLQEIITKPYLYTIPFLKKFLKYSTFTAGFKVTPEDALIFIDDKFYGTGSIENIILPKGRHRIKVEREGYRTASDLIYVEKDGFFREIELKKIEPERYHLVSSIPPGVSVYLDEKYLGNTPHFLSAGEEQKTITLMGKGYTPITINLDEIPDKTGRIELEIETISETELNHRKAERHKKKARIFSHLGLGFLGTAVLLGTQETFYQQKADLYQGIDSEKYTRALNTAKTLRILTLSSSVISCSLFTYSFREILNYFKGYSPPEP